MWATANAGNEREAMKATFVDVRFDYAPEGLICEIDMPLPNPEPTPAALRA